MGPCCPGGMHAACNTLINLSVALQVWHYLAAGDMANALQSLAHSMAMCCRRRPLRGRPGETPWKWGAAWPTQRCARSNLLSMVPGHYRRGCTGRGQC